LVKLGTLLKRKIKEKHKLKSYGKPRTQNKNNRIVSRKALSFLYSHIARLGTLN
jgi:hypothetical protein